MKTMNHFFNNTILTLLLAVAAISCSDDDVPVEENLPELFTGVTLVFTPEGGGETVTATATDPDGAGLESLVIEDDIILQANTTYTLTYDFENRVDPSQDLNAEILREDNEHQFFFEFTEDIFASPTGNGNIDIAADPINYSDEDENGNPVGLQSSWTTGEAATGTFTANLQHQPRVKTATSSSRDGDTDFFLTFDLVIE